MACVYCLLSTASQTTYIGATLHLERRLRQHNRELVGGAHATARKVLQGDTWTRACHVAGFPDWTAALQFEWRWKQLTRKLPAPLKRKSSLEKRLVALVRLLALPQSTTKAVPYATWPAPPRVILENDRARSLWASLGQVALSEPLGEDNKEPRVKEEEPRVKEEEPSGESQP